MARKKGSSKSGERVKGTPNHRTLILQEVLDSLDCDVPKRLTEILPQLDESKQADILLELMTYLYPKRKALEISGSETSPLRIKNTRSQLQQIMTDPEAMCAARTLVEKIANETQ